MSMADGDREENEKLFRQMAARHADDLEDRLDKVEARLEALETCLEALLSADEDEEMDSLEAQHQEFVARVRSLRDQ